jgi:TolA-binding protein
MKRTERQRLKQNEIANLLDWFVDFYEERRRDLNVILYVAIAVLIVAGGWYFWQQHRTNAANSLLAQADVVLSAPVVPPAAPSANGKPAPAPPPGSFPSDEVRLEAALPKLAAAADAYPSTRAGIAARYQQGASLLSLKRPADAVKAYQQVVNEAGNGLYGQMAKLGIAEAEAQQTHYDQAIATFKELSLSTDGDLPVDGILMQLGRTYLAAGRKTEAAQAFRRVVDEFPESPYTGEARRQLDSLQPVRNS